MTYKIVDMFDPRITTTLPRYAVYRKRKWFGWKYLGRSNDKDGDILIEMDFASHFHNEGEWIQVFMEAKK